MKKIIVFSITLIYSIAFLAAIVAAQTQIITEDDVQRAAENTNPTNAWMLYNRNAGDAQFVLGPATPPAGTGSFELSTPAGTDKVFLFNYEHIGTSLNAIDAISYATFRTAGSLQQVASLNIQVDYNGPDPGGFTTLVFEPVYNTSQGVVQNGIWQTWDAFSSGQARWWSTQNIPGVCSFNCFIEWDAILAANPSASIIGAFGINQGSGNAALLSAVDNLTLGKSGVITIYNFERDAPPVYTMPTHKDQCKNGGWMSFNPPSGPFPNQGQCVASTVRAN